MVNERFVLVAVHGGAGFHSKSPEAVEEVKNAMKLACSSGIQVFQDTEHNCPLDAVEASIVLLENDPCLNAGYGSNLTLHGRVECDAAIMSGETSDFGSVGALEGVKNPIKAARCILEHSRLTQPLGRVPPLTLVSTGAYSFCASHGIPTLPAGSSLVSPRAHSQWCNWKKRLEEAQSDPSHSMTFSNSQHPPSGTRQENTMMQDTVGALAFDNVGGIAAGVSSGGLLLKYPGRIGEAAIYGSGCYAFSSEDGNVKVACSVSGTGEHITRHTLAKQICDQVAASYSPSPSSSASGSHSSKLNSENSGSDSDESLLGTIQDTPDTHSILHDVLSSFYKSTFQKQHEPNPSAGVLLFVNSGEEKDPERRLWCAFTTESMAVGWACSFSKVEEGQEKIRTKILRRSPTTAKSDSLKEKVYICTLPIDTD
ncbi:Threonine aspartase 1 [Abortiporus biennis]